jgi:hypothetical protein
MIKIVGAIKGMFAPAKKPKSSIEYHDQKPWTMVHSSFVADREQQTDSWINPGGRRDFRGWFNR